MAKTFKKNVNGVIATAFTHEGKTYIYDEMYLIWWEEGTCYFVYTEEAEEMMKEEQEAV